VTTGARTLLTGRDDLAGLAWRDGLPDGAPLPAAGSLPEGAVLLQVEAVALTANTLTYGLLGERLRYWDFFPSARPGWGCLPGWGTARVEASALSELPPGSRISGLLPIATNCLLWPRRLTPLTLRDGAEHRRELPGPTSTTNGSRRPPPEPPDRTRTRRSAHCSARCSCSGSCSPSTSCGWRRRPTS